MTTTIDVTAIATTVSSIDEKLISVLPVIAGLAGFIPGAAAVPLIAPLALEILQVVDQAAKAVAANTHGAAFTDIFDEIKAHLTPGQANSPSLSPMAAPAA